VSRDQVILGLVALVLVGFSIAVSMLVPRRNPGFPGQNVRLFAAVSVLLVVGMLATVEVFGDEGHAEGESAEAEIEAGDTGPGDTGKIATESVPAETTEAGGGGTAQGDAERGKEVFAENCGTCHTLADAGTDGAVGPNLDDVQPSFEAAVDQVKEGGGGMPSFAGRLSDDDIEAVAAYVSQAAGG
jgi:mono/diheme cytochrome c family protein